MERLELYRTTATMPWARVDCLESGRIRITVYNGSQADCEEITFVLENEEAIELSKALKVVATNYK